MPKFRLIVAALVAVVGASGAWAQAEAPVVVVQATEPEPAAAGAPDAEDVEIDLDALLWVARPLVVFADSAADPRYAQQMQMIESGLAELKERRVIVLTDTDPAARGPLRRTLRPRGFGLVLIDTDGSVIQRRPAPTTVRELTGTIDRLPSRREEIGSSRP